MLTSRLLPTRLAELRNRPARVAHGASRHVVVALATLLLSGAPVFGQGNETLAVVPLPGVDPTGIAATVRGELAKEARFSVIDEEETRGRISAAADLGLTCEAGNVGCLAKLGVLADLRWVLAPIVTADTDGARLDLILIDVEKGAEDARTTRRLQGGDLSALAADAVAELVDPAGYKAFLVLSVDQAGATVQLDGERLGESPAEAFEIKPGTHQLVVTKDGFVDSVQQIAPKKQQTLNLDVVLVKAQATTGDDATAGRDDDKTSPPIAALAHPLVLGPAVVAGVGAAGVLLTGAVSLVAFALVFDLGQTADLRTIALFTGQVANVAFFVALTAMLVGSVIAAGVWAVLAAE